jgi:hypothetical protein
MPRDSRGGVALIEEDASSPRKNSGQNGCINGCAHMDNDITDEEIRAREQFVGRILSKKTVPIIQQGINAYERDRHQLMRESKFQHMVAYKGNERVAIAPTSRKLNQILQSKKLLNCDELFITCVLPADVETQTSRGS